MRWRTAGRVGIVGRAMESDTLHAFGVAACLRAHGYRATRRTGRPELSAEALRRLLRPLSARVSFLICL